MILETIDNIEGLKKKLQELKETENDIVHVCDEHIKSELEGKYIILRSQKTLILIKEIKTLAAEGSFLFDTTFTNIDKTGSEVGIKNTRLTTHQFKSCIYKNMSFDNFEDAVLFANLNEIELNFGYKRSNL